MRFKFLLFGLLAWTGVAALALLMAMWEEPVLGFFPILAAVFGAWAIGEVLEKRFQTGEHDVS